MKILVVDDEANIRNVIKEYAEFEGYEVEEAVDGMEAVSKCKDEDFDIVIMDVMMPKLDGFSAIKEIVSGIVCTQSVNDVKYLLDKYPLKV